MEIQNTAISPDRRIGLVGCILGVVGVGVTILWPDAKWLGWLFFVIGIIGFIGWLIWEVKAGVHSTRSRRVMYTFLAFLGCALLGITTSKVKPFSHPKHEQNRENAGLAQITENAAHYDIGGQPKPVDATLEILRNPKIADDSKVNSQKEPLLVPVTFRAVYEPNYRPAIRTIFTVKTPTGDIVTDGMMPDSSGTALTSLAPGRYVLTATESHQSINFVVQSPKTEVAIGIDRSVVEKDQSETLTLSAGTSADAMDKRLFVSLIAIDFGGTPLAHRVTFIFGGRDITAKKHTLVDVGQTFSAGTYQLRVASADTFNASFVVSKR